MRVKSDTRSLLRSLPTLVGTPPGFDPELAADNPVAQYLEWLYAAIAAAVPEPHAVTASTLGEDGVPDARVLILKDVTAAGEWCIAGSAVSVKGRQLTTHPVLALTSYWGAQMRSVRVRGHVTTVAPEEAARDFAERSDSARAIALAGVQSSKAESTQQIAAEVTASARELAKEPALSLAEWRVWKLRAQSVEFWEGASSRQHVRLRYEREPNSHAWRRAILRP